MKRVTFHLTAQQIVALRQHAQKTGLSVAELIRRAIDRRYQREEEKRDD